MQHNIANKVVVITGASSGLGETTARHLSSLGASVVLAARRKDRLDQLVDEITAAGGKAIAFATDVTRQQDVQTLIQGAVEHFGPGGTVYSGTKYAVSAISEGLRHEVGGAIRITTILPGAVDSELKFGSSHEQSANTVKDFYRQAIPSDSVARAIAYAIEQPDDVDINEIVLRPTVQEF